jgi:PTS system nitrogen regulatory IIA component
MKLSELVGERDILLGVRADRKRSALGAIAARLGEKLEVSQGAALAALLRRERLGPTSIGQGLALPHARLDGISAPAAVVARLQRPVPFGSPDDEPVDLLLALLWPKSDMKGFVPALFHACRVLRSGGLPGLLRRSSTPAEAHVLIGYFEEVTSDRAGGASSGSRRALSPGLLCEART